MPRSTAPWLCLPGIALLAVFFTVFVSFAGVSLQTVDPGGATFHGPASIANYTKGLSSEHVRYVVYRTLKLSAEITALSIVLGYPLAYLMSRSPSRLTRRVIMFSLIATFLSGGVTRAYAWMAILGNRGLVNHLLAQLGLPSVQLINNEIAVVISVLNFVLPFFVLTLFGALRAIPSTLEHAARNLGASRRRAFVHVVLPLSVPGLVAASTLAFVLSLSAFLFPQLLGGGRVHVIATLIFERIVASYDIPGAAALSVLFLVLTLGLLGLFALAQRLATPRGGTRAA